jgi:cytochrome bd-type quinol oxidase subunit 2
MSWLQRNAWRVLLVLVVLIGLVGAWAMLVGITEDPSVPLGLTGLTAAQIQTEGEGGYRLADYGVRVGGLCLLVIATLLSTIVVFGFRERRRWAWWAMWVLPIWGAATMILIIALGVAPGQAPPTPLISGLVVVVLSSLLLVVSAPLFRAD